MGHIRVLHNIACLPACVCLLLCSPVEKQRAHLVPNFSKIGPYQLSSGHSLTDSCPYFISSSLSFSASIWFCSARCYQGSVWPITQALSQTSEIIWIKKQKKKKEKKDKSTPFFYWQKIRTAPDGIIPMSLPLHNQSFHCEPFFRKDKEYWTSPTYCKHLEKTCYSQFCRMHWYFFSWC